MNHANTYPGSPREETWKSYLTNVWIWLSAAAAGVLLMWFVSVLNDITERGEQRRHLQRTSGMLLLPDELRARGVAAGSPSLAANADNVALR